MIRWAYVILFIYCFHLPTLSLSKCGVRWKQKKWSSICSVVYQQSNPGKDTAVFKRGQGCISVTSWFLWNFVRKINKESKQRPKICKFPMDKYIIFMCFRAPRTHLHLRLPLFSEILSSKFPSVKVMKCKLPRKLITKNHKCIWETTRLRMIRAFCKWLRNHFQYLWVQSLEDITRTELYLLTEK